MAYGQRVFTGDGLRAVAFPLGGIGTGNVSLGGRGDLRDWEVFNHPGKGIVLPYTFFALWARPQGGDPIARVLEGRFQPPYAGGFGPMNVSTGFGLPTRSVSGLPRFRTAAFSGAYPFAFLELTDPHVPLRAALEAYTPFIPLQADDSGLPVAVLNWTLTNEGDAPVDATVALSLLNAAGYDGVETLSNRHSGQFGGNINAWREAGGLRGLFLSGGKAAADAPQFGTLALATPWTGETTHALHWERAGWWDDLQNFWDDFSDDGRLPDQRESSPSPDGQSDVGTLGLCATVPPGGAVTLPFLLTWHFPNLHNTWNGEEAVKGKPLGNYYGTRFADAWAVAAHVASEGDRLAQETRDFADAFFDSTLPEPVLDAVSSQASILRTTTGLRTADGRYMAFEGCGDTWGCCPMNCTHVWFYTCAQCYLFPELERSMRLTDFANNLRPNGDMAFRTLLPLSADTLWDFKPAADGQMGCIMRAYREYLQCGDRAFLEALWPGIVRALEFAWRPGGWDADKDGVMEGEQHNTFDIEFYGPNTMVGTIYLGALRAAEEMARVLGHQDKAAEYRAVYESGREKYAALWNGEYFIQDVLPPAGRPYPRYQYGAGCLSDQLLGQWAARVIGLGHLLPEPQVKSALSAIFRYNWKPDLFDHANCQRTYALGEEAGLLLCSWPHGNRETYPFPYADEVWTGVEYEVAAHLIFEGLVEEGLTIVNAVRARYAGFNRNPWDEVECGHHYARAMSSYSLLVALSGCRYDAAAHHLAFAPRLREEDFRCFFTAGTAWGVFAQSRAGRAYAARLQPRWGELTLRSLGLPLDASADVTGTVDGQKINAGVPSDGVVRFEEPLTLRRGQSLEIQSQANSDRTP